MSTKTKLGAELVVLGGILAEFRERAGIRQYDLAAILGLPASYLSKVEKGTRRLDVVELIRIADAMSVDPSDILRELRTALQR